MSARSTPQVIIHADESCLGNQNTGDPRPGGAAGLVEYWNGGEWIRRDYWLSSPDTTNNQMAIQSAIAGLQGLTRPCRVRFVSDSQYLVKGMSQWIRGWKQKGWMRKGEPIPNAELWKELDDVASHHEITWEWVRGHDGNPRNEYVDNLAVTAAEEQSASDGLVDSGFESWLGQEREQRGLYQDFAESAAPEERRQAPTSRRSP